MRLSELLSSLAYSVIFFLVQGLHKPSSTLESVTNSHCAGGPSCRKKQTCCNKGPYKGCCPYSNAVCCTGTKYCCPHGYKCCGKGTNVYCCPSSYTCNVKARNCIKYVTDASGEVLTTNQQPAKLTIQQQETTHEEKPVENQPPAK